MDPSDKATIYQPGSMFSGNNPGQTVPLWSHDPADYRVRDMLSKQTSSLKQKCHERYMSYLHELHALKSNPDDFKYYLSLSTSPLQTNDQETMSKMSNPQEIIEFCCERMSWYKCEEHLRDITKKLREEKVNNIKRLETILKEVEDYIRYYLTQPARFLSVSSRKVFRVDSSYDQHRVDECLLFYVQGWVGSTSPLAFSILEAIGEESIAETSDPDRNALVTGSMSRPPPRDPPRGTCENIEANQPPEQPTVQCVIKLFK